MYLSNERFIVVKVVTCIVYTVYTKLARCHKGHLGCNQLIVYTYVVRGCTWINKSMHYKLIT